MRLIPRTALLAASLFATQSVSHVVAITLTASDSTVGTSSFNTGLHWSDGLAPSAGNDYLVNTTGYTLRTPQAAGDYTFGGNSLTITKGGLALKGTTANNTITISNFILGAATVGASSGVTANLAGQITLSGATVFNGANNMNVTANVTSSGTNSLAVSPNTGVAITMSGVNTYSGGTTVSGGTVSTGTASVFQVDNTSGSGTGSGTVTVNGASSAYGVIAGGAGSANGGTLNAAVGGATRGTYAPNAIGIIAGAVTVTSLGHLAPGNSAVGTLTMASLTLSSGSVLDYEFNGSANDFTKVTGALTLNTTGVTINLLQEGTTTAFASPGVYNLVGYGSGSTINTSDISVANAQSGFNYSFTNDTTDGILQLDITNVPEQSTWVMGIFVVGAGLYTKCFRGRTGRRRSGLVGLEHGSRPLAATATLPSDEPLMSLPIAGSL